MAGSWPCRCDGRLLRHIWPCFPEIAPERMKVTIECGGARATSRRSLPLSISTWCAFRSFTSHNQRLCIIVQNSECGRLCILTASSHSTCWGGWVAPSDPERPDDVCKGYGALMIIKLPFETLAWRSPHRPLRTLDVWPDSGCNVPDTCRSIIQAVGVFRAVRDNSREGYLSFWHS